MSAMVRGGATKCGRSGAVFNGATAVSSFGAAGADLPAAAFCSSRRTHGDTIGLPHCSRIASGLPFKPLACAQACTCGRNACLHISTIWSWLAASVGPLIRIQPSTFPHIAAATAKNGLRRSDMLPAPTSLAPTSQPSNFRGVLSRQQARADRLGIFYAGEGLRVGCATVGLEHRTKEINVSVVTAKAEHG